MSSTRPLGHHQGVRRVHTISPTGRVHQRFIRVPGAYVHAGPGAVLRDLLMRPALAFLAAFIVGVAFHLALLGWIPLLAAAVYSARHISRRWAARVRYR